MLRNEDTVARLSGDEFAIVLPHISHVGKVGDVANRLLAELAKPHLIDGQELYLYASLGIALYPGDGDNPETLLTNADAAMYHAKRAGRGNYQFFAHSLRLKVIAEGVETDDQLGVLRALKCDEYQGFLCTAPLPAEQLAIMLREHVAMADISGVC